MKRVIPVIRIILFGMVLAFIITAVDYPLVRPGSQEAFRNVDGFYELKRDTLDAVYIGSSRVYAFWNPMFAYARNGIAVYSFATAAQSILMTRYLVEEAHKTQPHAVMIVNLDSIRGGLEASLRRVTDRMPLSATKLRLVWQMGEKRGERVMDRIAELFPLSRYHSRWQKLETEDFLYEPGRYMSASRYETYLSGHKDVTIEYRTATDKATDPDTETREAIDALLDYCVREKIEVLFTLAPQAGIDCRQMEIRTGLRDYIISQGGVVLDFQNSPNEIGLDLAQDYDNERHTNIHGSFKFTAYLSDELIRRYGFTDKRGMHGYEDWDTALNNYRELVDPYVLPFEWQTENRTGLPKVEVSADFLPEGKVCLSFSPVSGAEGYTVFRKKGQSAAWERIDDCRDGKYTDVGGKSGWYYAVVPFIEDRGIRLYGDVDYAGTKVE